MLVGDGPEKGEIIRLSKKLGIDNKILLLGKVSDFQLMRVLQSCDALILPSLSEVFPLTILEALAFNRPVISTNVGCIKEISSKNLHIAENLKDFIPLLFKLNRTVSSIDEDIVTNFSLDKISTRFESLYYNLQKQSR